MVNNSINTIYNISDLLKSSEFISIISKIINFYNLNNKNSIISTLIKYKDFWENGLENNDIINLYYFFNKLWNNDIKKLKSYLPLRNLENYIFEEIYFNTTWLIDNIKNYIYNLLDKEWKELLIRKKDKPIIDNLENYDLWDIWKVYYVNNMWIVFWYKWISKIDLKDFSLITTTWDLWIWDISYDFHEINNTVNQNIILKWEYGVALFNPFILESSFNTMDLWIWVINWDKSKEFIIENNNEYIFWSKWIIEINYLSWKIFTKLIYNDIFNKKWEESNKQLEIYDLEFLFEYELDWIINDWEYRLNNIKDKLIWKIINDINSDNIKEEEVTIDIHFVNLLIKIIGWFDSFIMRELNNFSSDIDKLKWFITYLWSKLWIDENIVNNENELFLLFKYLVDNKNLINQESLLENWYKDLLLDELRKIVREELNLDEKIISNDLALINSIKYISSSKISEEIPEYNNSEYISSRYNEGHTRANKEKLEAKRNINKQLWENPFLESWSEKIKMEECEQRYNSIDITSIEYLWKWFFNFHWNNKIVFISNWKVILLNDKKLVPYTDSIISFDLNKKIIYSSYWIAKLDDEFNLI